MVEFYCGHVFMQQKNGEGSCAGKYNEKFAAHLKVLLQAMPSVNILDLCGKWFFYAQVAAYPSLALAWI